jgi:hypothetical protein
MSMTWRAMHAGPWSSAIAKLTADLARSDTWPAADRERVSRELLLRFDRGRLAHCDEAFSDEAGGLLSH